MSTDSAAGAAGEEVAGQMSMQLVPPGEVGRSTDCAADAAGGRAGQPTLQPLPPGWSARVNQL